MPCGLGVDGHYAAIRLAQRQIRGKIFLDGNALVEIGIRAQIRHAETADPQHGFQPVFEQHRAHRERVTVGRRGGHGRLTELELVKDNTRIKVLPSFLVAYLRRKIAPLCLREGARLVTIPLPH